MIELGQHPQGVVLTVKVAPKSRANELRGEHAGMLKVAVTAAPEKGKANAAVQELLCAALQLSHSQVSILQGETASTKKFLIQQLPGEELLARIASALDD
jgi:uncharacterized protein